MFLGKYRYIEPVLRLRCGYMSLDEEAGPLFLPFFAAGEYDGAFMVWIYHRNCSDGTASDVLPTKISFIGLRPLSRGYHPTKKSFADPQRQ